MQTRLATVEPKTLNKEARTVEVVWTTGAGVVRGGFFTEPFIQTLGMKKKNVKMGRLKNKAPFLDTHGFGEGRGVKSVIGVVESAELIPEKEGRAVIRFSKREEVEEIFQDVVDRILTHVSVGFNILEAKEIGEDKRTGMKIIEATLWEPVEISLVPAGADDAAQVRSADCPTTECELEEIEETVEPETRTEPEIKEEVAKPSEIRDTNSTGDIDMTPEQIEIAKKEAETKTRNEAAVAEKNRSEAAAAEKIRAKDIREVVSKVKLDSKLADKYIDEDKTIDEVRTLVIDAIADKDETPESDTRSANYVGAGEDLSRKGRIEGMESALLHRFRPQDQETTERGQKLVLPGYELSEQGREYAYLSLIDMARACIEAQGIRTGSLPRHRIVDMALGIEGRRGLHSTSDFPEILANVINKTLRNGYLAAPQTFMPFTNEVFVNDFKEISRTNLGDSGKLLKLQEGSEVKGMTISETAEKYFVEEYARKIGISRKVIINDDLEAFTKIPERMGRRAKDLESDLVWDIFKANANLADGVALFAAAHGNLSTAPGDPSETGLGELRTSMRRQTGLDEAEISLTPAWVFVPPAHETVMEKLLATTRPNNASDVNPFGPQGRTTLRMDVEPRLESGSGGSLTAWFGTADKGQIDMIELARLSGTNGPQTVTREGFDVNGVEVKIMHDIGAKAIDFRGLYKNAGA